MAQRVRIPHRGRRPFVCHTTPHSDSTSREVPTLFAPIIHKIAGNVNTFPEIFREFSGSAAIADDKSVGLWYTKQKFITSEVLTAAMRSDNFFWRWFSRLPDVLILSLLWLLCCLPVLTIGASCVALYDTIARCVHGPGDRPYRHFFQVFKAELPRGIGLSALWLGLAALLTAGFFLLRSLSGQNDFFSAYTTIYLGTMLIPVAALIWLIPLQSRFSYGFWALHKASVTFAIVHLPTTGIALLLLLAAAALIALVPILGLVLPGLTVTAQCFFIEKILKEYMDDEEAQTDD